MIDPENAVPVSETDEWALLACAVVKPEILPGLDDSLFYLKESRTVLKRLRQMQTEGADHIERRILSELNSNNWPLCERLNHALTDCPSAHNWPWYAENLSDVRREREIQAIAAELAGGGNPLEIAERVKRLDATPQTASTVKKLVQAATAGLQEEYENPAALQGIPTGFGRLDRMIRGLHPGHLVVIGARPGMGKTSFALNIATRAAIAGTTTSIYSLEMPADELMQRMIVSESQLCRRAFQARELTERDFAKFRDVSVAMAGSPLTVHDHVHELNALTSDIAAQGQNPSPPKLVLVDYLQLIRVRDVEQRYQQVGAASRALKLAAMANKTAIIALAQISRQVEKENRRPNLSDLRESGDIEQDADVVGFLHPAEDRTGFKPQSVDLIVAKNRHGELGDVPLMFNHRITRFFERTPDIPAEKSNHQRGLPPGDH